ncbi:oxidoreductase, aldo/keto reductase family [Verrucomicrobiia bacterium DG1235]|nr:oxidoreductase, aldo/keto reductase family [Verrucomicrobiae bacterium DG1235]
MPIIGMGTFGSDHVSPEEMAEATIGAAEAGYRHFDCAEVYGNEFEIGRSLEAMQAGGIPREELWINSKVWNNHHAPQDTISACERSLENLRLDYLDLYLVHWPFPNFHPPGCSVDSRSPDSRPYSHLEFMKTWEAMESLLARGLVRNIGVSNMTIPKLKLLLADASIKPACNEMEIHPHFQQAELFSFLQSHEIVPIGYCPLGSPSRPERDRTADDTSDLEDPTIVSIAQAHDTHPTAVCLKWAAQRGQIPIPMSKNPSNYRANLRAILEDPLTDSEMKAISKIDRNCRLIKGQVFLWQGARNWEDLWDLDGSIPS